MDRKHSTIDKFDSRFANVLGIFVILALALVNTGFAVDAARSDTTEAWDSAGVMKPSVLRENSVYKIWYDGTDQNGNIRIGFAKSENGKIWKKSHAEPNSKW